MGTLLTDAACHRTLPSTFVITTQPHFRDVITTVIDSTAKQIVGEHAHAFTLPHEVLEGIAGHNFEPDTFITIAARFFHKLHGCGEIGSR